MNGNEEDIIFKCRKCINDFRKIRNVVEEADDDDVKIKICIETKHLMGYSEPFLGKRRSNIYSNKDSALSLIESAIAVKEIEIDNAIDSLINKKIKMDKINNNK